VLVPGLKAVAEPRPCGTHMRDAKAQLQKVTTRGEGARTAAAPGATSWCRSPTRPGSATRTGWPAAARWSGSAAAAWGGVIGIGGGFELVDGTHITVPRFAFWMEGPGWGVENHGVDPDVEVLITPDDWAAGTDTQLETAIGLATEALQATPAAAPPSIADRPSRRRPALPPRPGRS
jgi:hypothetical protein